MFKSVYLNFIYTYTIISIFNVAEDTTDIEKNDINRSEKPSYFIDTMI